MNEIRKNRNRELFIQTACEIIEKEGVEAATIRTIAAKAGYNSATLYSYFKDRSHLLVCAHMKFEEEIQKLMQEEFESCGKSYYEIWPQMYLIVAHYYLSHPNAFECSFLYKNEKGEEKEIRMIQQQESVFQRYIFDNFQRIAEERKVPIQQILKVHASCISMLIGTLVLVLRQRIERKEEDIVNDLNEGITIIINNSFQS